MDKWTMDWDWYDQILKEDREKTYVYVEPLVDVEFNWDFIDTIEALM